MKHVGIDEAGRGSVLGPLVVCGVAIEEERLKYLERLKLKDSKKITPKRRVVLSRKIKKIAECHSVHISANDIESPEIKGYKSQRDRKNCNEKNNWRF